MAFDSLPLQPLVVGGPPSAKAAQRRSNLDPGYALILLCTVVTVAIGAGLYWKHGKAVAQESTGPAMAEPSGRLNQKVLEIAQEAIQEYGDKISLEAREHILVQRVVLGMSPFEALLAGGTFVFRVQADRKVWPRGTDPYRIIYGQSLAPDDSRIWMTFETETQFPGEGRQGFTVEFEIGKAIKIER